MTGTSTSAPAAHTINQCGNDAFDPGAWLSRYAELGGIYTTTDTKLNLCILVTHQTEDELSCVREMISGLTVAHKAALHAHLTVGPTSTTWAAALAKYEALSAEMSAHQYGRALPSDPGFDALDREHGELCKASNEALRNLVTAPAPNHEALITKLKVVAKEYGDVDGVCGPFIADVDRLRPKLAEADRSILDAWERRSAAYKRYNELPFGEDQPGGTSPEEDAEWEIIDAAEEMIRSHAAITAQAVSIQLWTALQHRMTQREDEAACLRRDLPALQARGAELDWTERLILAALRSLEQMGA